MWIFPADDSAAIPLGHWPSEHRLSVTPTRCLTSRARIPSRLSPLTHDSPPRRTIFWLLYLTRTSAVSCPCPWRDPCQWSVAEPARSMPRVGVSCTALFALFSLTDVAPEGCHISWVWTPLRMRKRALRVCKGCGYFWRRTMLQSVSAIGPVSIACVLLRRGA